MKPLKPLGGWIREGRLWTQKRGIGLDNIGKKI
jgi:hypothetical protein